VGGLLRHDSVAAQAQAVHPGSQPISISTNSGLSTREPLEEGGPSGAVSGPRGPTAASVSVTPECRPLSVEYPAAPPAFESPTVGVGHFCSAASESCPRRCPGRLDPLWSVALGVGHCLQATVSGTPAPLPLTPFALSRSARARKLSGLSPSFVRLAVGVGQLPKDEEPLPAVRGADFSRSEESRFNAVAHFAQLSEHQVGPQGKMPGDVLEEAPPGSDLAHDASDVGPQVPGVVGAEALAGERERLARVSASDEIHDSTPRLAVEGSQIRPNRARVQPPFFHARSQDRAGIGFDLDSTDRASSSERHSDAEVEPAGSGGEGQHVDGRKIHT